LADLHQIIVSANTAYSELKQTTNGVDVDSKKRVFMEALSKMPTECPNLSEEVLEIIEGDDSTDVKQLITPKLPSKNDFYSLIFLSTLTDDQAIESVDKISRLDTDVYSNMKLEDILKMFESKEPAKIIKRDLQKILTRTLLRFGDATLTLVYDGKDYLQIEYKSGVSISDAAMKTLLATQVEEGVDDVVKIDNKTIRLAVTTELLCEISASNIPLNSRRLQPNLITFQDQCAEKLFFKVYQSLGLSENNEEEFLTLIKKERNLQNPPDERVDPWYSDPSRKFHEWDSLLNSGNLNSKGGSTHRNKHNKRRLLRTQKSHNSRKNKRSNRRIRKLGVFTRKRNHKQLPKNKRKTNKFRRSISNKK
jgi:hypothetical protein